MNKKLNHINKIEIEFQSFCNRLCEWCPNKKFLRNKHNKILSINNYINLLYQLNNSNYKGDLALIGYQEAFSNFKLFKKYVDLAHLIFNNKIRIFSASNGDYFNNQDLANIKLSNLVIEDYDNKGKEYWINKLASLPVKEIYYDPKKETLRFSYKNIKTGIIKLNWTKHVELENRGGFFQPGDLSQYNWTNNMELRSIPCAEPTYFITIAHDGSVMPCCHMRPDNPNHQQYILGNIKKQSIIDIYYSEKAQKFREQVRTRSNNDFPEPCKRCQKCREHLISGSPDGWTYKGLEYYEQNKEKV